MPDIQRRVWRILAVLLMSATLPLILTESSRSQSSDRTITVRTTGQADIPADQILFSIQIRIESDEAKKAFQEHRERESYLAKLIKKSGIEEKQITFQPVRISKVERHRPAAQQETTTYRTHQRVQLRLNDFGLFDTMQVKLINNGFDSFNAAFRSSESDEGEKEALDEALRKAREKAQQIARRMDVELGTVKRIDYSGGGDGPIRRSAEALHASSDSMMDFAQTVTVTETVSVIYTISGP